MTLRINDYVWYINSYILDSLPSEFQSFLELEKAINIYCNTQRPRLPGYKRWFFLFSKGSGTERIDLQASVDYTTKKNAMKLGGSVFAYPLTCFLKDSEDILQIKKRFNVEIEIKEYHSREKF